MKEYLTLDTYYSTSVILRVVVGTGEFTDNADRLTSADLKVE